MKGLEGILCLLVALAVTVHWTTGETLEENTNMGVKAKIEPHEPMLLSGNNLTLTCTLESNVLSVSSSDLYFTSLDLPLEENVTSQTTLLNSSSIQIVIWKVHRNHNWSSIACRMENNSLDEVTIIVDDHPRAPDSIDCRVYNWERMICIWKKEPFNVRLSYRRGSCRSGQLTCHNLILNDTHDYCEWGRGPDSFLLNDHCLRFSASNSFGNNTDSRLIIKKASDIVQPDPVKIVNCTLLDNPSHRVWLSWTPSTTKPLFYRVSYKSRLSDEIIRTPSDTHITLSQLVPHSVYSVSIDCIPNRNGKALGFWSNATSISFSTLSDVPGDSPNTTPGGFIEPKYNATHRTIQLFFQPPGERYAHGVIERYRVNYSTENSSISFESNATNVNFTVRHDDEYEVTVEARTTVGYNDSLILRPITIAKQKDKPALPERLLAMTDGYSSYFLNWTEVNETSSYTVYWCRRTFGPFECMNEYQWKTVPANQTSEVLVDLPNQPWCFAVSAEKILPSGKEVSSGMLITNCTYSKNEGLKPPKDLHARYDAESQALVVEWPNPQGSDCSFRAYASHYIITYCVKDNCNKTTKSIIVDSNHHSLEISGLNTSGTYIVKIMSSSDGRMDGMVSEAIKTEAEVSVSSSSSSWPSWATALIVVVAVFVFALVFIAVGACTHKILKCRKWWKEPIKIKTPQRYIIDPTQIQDDVTCYTNIHATRAENRERCSSETSSMLSELKTHDNNNTVKMFNHGTFTTPEPATAEAMLLGVNGSGGFSECSIDSGVSPNTSSSSSTTISGYNLVIERQCSETAICPIDCETSAI